MPAPRLSFVIPTYNRRDLLPAAVDSALAWIRLLGNGQIIIVDDGSTDGTADAVRTRYRDELDSAVMIFHERASNGGAAAAKNTGAALANRDWIVFLDSDDRLVEDAATVVIGELQEAEKSPVVFFRCVEASTGSLVGDPLAEGVSIGLIEHISKWKWGECLPIVRAEASRRFSYVEELPGYEAISYFRMIRAFGRVRVSPTIARIYRTEGDDRVSAAGRLKRGIRNEKYARIMLSEFRRDLPLVLRMRFVLTYVRSRFDMAIARSSRILRAAH